MTKKKEETKEIKKASLKEVTKKDNKNTSSKGKKKEKVNVFSKISSFINGVKAEFKRVKWPTKKEMIKYSTITIVFIIGFALFFYLIEIILAALHSIGR